MKKSCRKNKKVCILRSNPVNPDSRVEKEADALYEAGYEVHIFCWDRDGNHQIQEDSIHKGTIPIYRCGCLSSYGGGMKNLKAYLKFQFRMFAWLLKNASKYEVIHACDFDTAFFSYFPARLRKSHFVFDVFDFICGDPHNLLEKIVKKVEYWLINHADATIICTEQRREQIIGSKPRKLEIIHNSPDSRTNTSKHPIEVDTEKVSIVYVGVLLDNRLLSEIISVIERRKDINLYIGGFGMLEDEIKEASIRAANIFYLGKLSYEQTLSLESACNIMTAIYDPTVENHIYAASNKFYESLMLGKPVLMVRGTGMADVIEKNKIGEVIEYSIEDFEKGLDKLIRRKEEWPEISKKMKKLYFEVYNWSIMKERLVRLYNEIESD